MCFSFVKAQLSPTIGQFHQTQLFYNPAYAGGATSFRATLIHRNQWTKLEGAPNTQVITADAPISESLGFGAVAYRHEAGYTQQVEVNANLSYRLKINKKSFLQFGIKAGAGNVRRDFNGVRRWDEGDDLIHEGITDGQILKIGAGLYYKRKEFYAGLSVPDLVVSDNNKMFQDSELGKSTLDKNYFLMAGTLIPLSEFISFKPNMLVRYYSATNLNAYVNLGFLFNQTFTAGVSISNPALLGLYARVIISPKLKIGYQYEFPNEKRGVSNSATNEFLISYGFN